MSEYPLQPEEKQPYIQQTAVSGLNTGGNLTVGNVTQIQNIQQTAVRVKSNPPNNLQFTGSANFVGRSHELTILREKFQQTDSVAISAVSGMGGVGKTELAIQYVKKYESDYPGGICWLSARESDLAASIVQFALLHIHI